MATIAPVAAPGATTTWTPTHLNFQANVQIAPDTHVEADARWDLRPEGVATDPTTQRVEMIKAGVVIGGGTKSAPLSSAERAAMAGVVDALAGTDYLTRAKAPAHDVPVAANHMRLSFVNEAGVPVGFDLYVPKLPAGYDKFGAAMKAYNVVAGLDKM